MYIGYYTHTYTYVVVCGASYVHAIHARFYTSTDKEGEIEQATSDIKSVSIRSLTTLGNAPLCQVPPPITAVAPPTLPLRVSIAPQELPPQDEIEQLLEDTAPVSTIDSKREDELIDIAPGLHLTSEHIL